MTRASLVPYAWVLGIVLLLVLGTATAVSMRFLRSVKRDIITPSVRPPSPPPRLPPPQ